MYIPVITIFRRSFGVRASVKCFTCIIAFYPHRGMKEVVITHLLEMRKPRLIEAPDHSGACQSPIPRRST